MTDRNYTDSIVIHDDEPQDSLEFVPDTDCPWGEILEGSAGE